MAFTQIYIPPIEDEKHTGTGRIEGRNIFTVTNPRSQCHVSLAAATALSPLLVLRQKHCLKIRVFRNYERSSFPSVFTCFERWLIFVTNI